jgi:hypothetical protein
MNTQNNIELNEDKKICYGLGCFNYASHSIQEDGYDGKLLLCDNCIIKFLREGTDKPPKFNSRFSDQRFPIPPIRTDQSNSGRTEL